MNWSGQSDFQGSMKCTMPEPEKARGSANVFFACHPDDFRDWFEEITDDITKIRKCAIWYYEPDGEDHSKEIEQNILFMNLVVVPVTENLLVDWQSIDQAGISYALEHNISVLPVVVQRSVERDRLEEYKKHFGNLQYICRYETNDGALSYESKLANHLESLLFDEETVQKVKNAFDAMIFISYRKKDREKVNNLIRLIHREPDFRNIAVWYDEFLTLGEDFLENIKEAIDQSVLCTLAVTESILEPGNFILENEYGMMRSAGKEILPVELAKTDPETLESLYGIRSPVNIGNREEFYRRLGASLKNTGFTRTRNDPVHDYLLGLAYMKGIQTSIDREYSLELLESAANNGVIEAMPLIVSQQEFKPANSSRSRDGYEEAVRWQKRYIEALEEKQEASRQGETGRIYIQALFYLAALHHERYRFEIWHADFFHEKMTGNYREEEFFVLQQIRDYTSDFSCGWFREEYAEACLQQSRITEGAEKEQNALEGVRIFRELSREEPTAIHLEKAYKACLEASRMYGKAERDRKGGLIRNTAACAAELREKYPSKDADLIYINAEFEYGEWLREADCPRESREHYDTARILTEDKRKIRNTRQLRDILYPIYASISRSYGQEQDWQNAIAWMDRAVEILRESKGGDRFSGELDGNLWKLYEALERYYEKLGDYEKRKKNFLLKQEYMHHHKETPYRLQEYSRFAYAAIAHNDYETAIFCRQKELDGRWREADSNESMEEIVEAREIGQRYLAEAREWAEGPSREALKVLEEETDIIRRKIEFWEWCDENDMPYHRPD